MADVFLSKFNYSFYSILRVNGINIHVINKSAINRAIMKNLFLDIFTVILLLNRLTIYSFGVILFL